jgi:hypothetical protein
MFRGAEYGTPPIVTSICSIFAKSSAIWIPLLYAGTSTQFRLAFVNHGALQQQLVDNRVGIDLSNEIVTVTQNNQWEMASRIGRNSRGKPAPLPVNVD